MPIGIPGSTLRCATGSSGVTLWFPRATSPDKRTARYPTSRSIRRQQSRTGTALWLVPVVIEDCCAAPRNEGGREGGGGEALRDFSPRMQEAAQQKTETHSPFPPKRIGRDERVPCTSSTAPHPMRLLDTHPPPEFHLESPCLWPGTVRRCFAIGHGALHASRDRQPAPHRIRRRHQEPSTCCTPNSSSSSKPCAGAWTATSHGTVSMPAKLSDEQARTVKMNAITEWAALPATEMFLRDNRDDSDFSRLHERLVLRGAEALAGADRVPAPLPARPGAERGRAARGALRVRPGAGAGDADAAFLRRDPAQPLVPARRRVAHRAGHQGTSTRRWRATRRATAAPTCAT